MNRLILIALLLPGLLLGASLKKKHALSVEQRPADPQIGQWIASGGFGLTFHPTLILLSPQLEYMIRPNLLVGPMVQAGLGDATLVTVSGTIRYLIGNHPKIKPSVEGGLGLGFGSGLTSSVGVHLMGGMGVEYIIDRSLRVGTMLRVNLAPPLQTFFVTWPLVIARFYL